MIIWTILTYAMLMVGVAGDLGGHDLWSLIVEAEKDAPNRRITPKHLFATPNHRNRAEECQKGHRYDHLGKCVPIIKPSKVDLTKELGFWKRRKPTTAPAIDIAPAPSPVFQSSTGPYQVSIPLGTEKPSTASSLLTSRSEPVSTTAPSPALPSIQPVNSTILDLITSATPPIEVEVPTELPEVVSTTSSPTDDEILTPVASTEATPPSIPSTTELVTKTSTYLIRTTTTAPVPTEIQEESFLEASTRPPFVGSGAGADEGSGLEGSGFATEPEDTTTLQAEEVRPLRSTTLMQETTTEEMSKDFIATPAPTKPSLLLSMLKGDFIPKDTETTERIGMTTTEYPPVTTEETEKTDWLPVVEFVGIDFPKADERNKSGQVVQLDDAINTDKFSSEVPKENPTQPAVLFFDFDKEEFIPEKKINTDRGITEPWIEEIPSPWVRFPDSFSYLDNRRDIPRGSDFSTRPTVFRFPEEIVQPEHRPTLLKFWSRIPMYQSGSRSKEQVSSSEDF